LKQLTPTKETEVNQQSVGGIYVKRDYVRTKEGLNLRKELLVRLFARVEPLHRTFLAIFQYTKENSRIRPLSYKSITAEVLGYFLHFFKGNVWYFDWLSSASTDGTGRGWTPVISIVTSCI
jgi:hypothetical protein